MTSRTILSRLLSPMTIVLADQTVVSGTRLAAQIVIARFAAEGSPGVGFYVSTFGFIVLAVMFIESFVTTPINVFLPQQTEKTRASFFADAFRAALRIVGSIIAVCAIVFFISRLLNWHIGERTAGVLIWYLPFHLVREFGRRWMLVTNCNAKLLAFDSLVSIGLMLAILFCIKASWFDAILVLALTTAANISFVALWWQTFRKEVDMREDVDVEFAAVAKGYGRWVAAEGLFSVVLVYFTQWHVTTTLGHVVADRFASCMTLVFIANPFLLGIVSYLSPRTAQVLAKAGVDGLRKMTYVYAATVGAILLLLGISIWFGGDWLMVSIFGERFDDLGATVTILSFGMMLFGIGYVFATSLQAAQAPNLNFIASILAGTFVVAFSLLFLRNDVNVAAWSFLISAGIGTATRAGLLHWKLKEQECDNAMFKSEQPASGDA